MLDVLRKRKRSWIIIFLLGLIIVVFIAFYGGNKFHDPALQDIAEVNGEVITQREFVLHYQKELERYREMFKGSLTPELEKNLNLRGSLLEQLIEKRLILQEARNLGFGGLRFRKKVVDRQANKVKIDLFLLEAVAVAHLVFRYMHAIEKDAIKSLDRQLFALFLFELAGAEAVGAQKLEVAFFIESAVDLKGGDLRNSHHQIIVVNRQSEMTRLLEHQPFLDELFE